MAYTGFVKFVKTLVMDGICRNFCLRQLHFLSVIRSLLSSFIGECVCDAASILYPLIFSPSPIFLTYYVCFWGSNQPKKVDSSHLIFTCESFGVIVSLNFFTLPKIVSSISSHKPGQGLLLWVLAFDITVNHQSNYFRAYMPHCWQFLSYAYELKFTLNQDEVEFKNLFILFPCVGLILYNRQNK